MTTNEISNHSHSLPDAPLPAAPDDHGDTDAHLLGTVLQVRAGEVRAWGGEHTEDGSTKRVWYSGIGTDPVPDAVPVGREGIDGDEQADRRHHGGPEKALFVHPVEHYAAWRTELDLPEMGPGGFGENLVLTGCDETEICLGDVVRIGELEAQVSQPRRPCWKPARRWGVPDFVVRIVTTGRTGWYLRVREPGSLRAGDVVELVERPHPTWSVARTSTVIHNRQHYPDAARELATVPGIPERWRNDLEKAARTTQENS